MPLELLAVRPHLPTRHHLVMKLCHQSPLPVTRDRQLEVDHWVAALVYYLRCLPRLLLLTSQKLKPGQLMEQDPAAAYLALDLKSLCAQHSRVPCL